MEIARKVTGAYLTKGSNLKGIEKKTYLGRIYGVVGRVEYVTTQFGEQPKFIGEFVALRVDGKEACAPTAFFPSFITQLLEKGMKESNGRSINFGFDFYADPSDKSKTGYVWSAKPLMDVKPSESLLAFAKDFPAVPTADHAQPKAEKGKPAKK